MSDHMHPIDLSKLIQWIDEESARHSSVFGIPLSQVYRPKKNNEYSLFGQSLDNLVGPAAGPHTQMANNIIVSYLTGGRFIELKTVQILDELVIDKPCIDARDEGYNVEWSQELKLEQAFDEYLKAWLLMHVLGKLTSGATAANRGFIFNMSVGYNLEGIKSERVDKFIEQLKNAAISEQFSRYKGMLIDELKNGRFYSLIRAINRDVTVQQLIDVVEAVPAGISNSITLSTMHGCPANEIESIAQYLMSEKKIHTFVKMNPTLLGYDFVTGTLKSLGYGIELDRHAFEKDIVYDAAVPMIKRLQQGAAAAGVQFGIKLSNTLGVRNFGEALPGSEQYLSGRALYPLTINLAAKIANEFKGAIRMSYSGGITTHNISNVVGTGISPVTLATDLLKPGGYLRLKGIAEKAEEIALPQNLNVEGIKSLADSALSDKLYNKASREVKSIKVPLPLPLTDCYMAPCTAACPVHQDVADYIHLAQEGRYKEALSVILDKNPLPHITGYICDHQCMFHCTRQDYDEAVAIRDIKRLAAEKGFDELLADIKKTFAFKSNKVRVAIIGAGPSGLSAAFFLAVNGFEVTVFDKEKSAGGVVRNIIPQFRIPQSVIDDDIKLIEQLGVKFVFEAEASFSVEALKSQGYKYVYIAIGAGVANELELTENNGRVIDALPFLRDYNAGTVSGLGKNVAVIGGGNSAMDSARAAKRTAGVENVYIIYRRTVEQMPADKEEYDAALEDGVVFHELVLPHSFADGKLKCQIMKLTEKGADGRRNVVPVDGGFKDFAIDTVITAIGEKVELTHLTANNIKLTEKKKPVLSEKYKETSVENVFIGGDALRGPSTVIESAADGRETAKAITAKENIEFKTLLTKMPSQDIPFRIDKAEKIKGVISMRQSDLTMEAGRCLSCNLVCNKCVEVCPNRANVAVDLEQYGSLFRDAHQIIHVDDLCNECGNCETFCPYNGKPYRQKVTVFSSSAHMKDSENDGFFIDRENRLVYIRVKGNETEVDLAAIDSTTKDPILALVDTVVNRYQYLS